MTRSQNRVRYDEGEDSTGDTHYPGSDHTWDWVGTWPSGGAEGNPILDVAPVFTPDAPMKIGTSYTITPGTYSVGGVGPVSVVTKWIVGGVDQANPYTPDAGDDLATMTLNEVATEPGGSTTTQYTAGTVTYEIPATSGTIADQIYAQGGGIETIETVAKFTGFVASYQVTTLLGVSIDALTGVISVDTDVADLQTTTAITVTVSNSGGEAQSSFDLSIVVGGPTQTVAPSFLPAGPMKIGTAYTITPGTYSAQGGGSIGIVSKWVVGGVDRPNPYTPEYTDDATLMVLDEVATETGGTSPGNTSTSISAGTVTYVAPAAGTTLADQAFAENTGIQTYDVTSGATGTDLLYEINVETGVTIDAALGIVSFNTDVMAVQTSTPMTVTYSNSGGSTGMPFNLDITTAVVISNLIADPNGDINFDTNTGEGTAYVVFNDNAAPSAASVVAGTGDVAANFSVILTGGQSSPIDLSSLAGLTKYCSVVQTNALGAQSNVITVSIDIGVAPVITGVPTIGGTTTEGQTLTATAASVSGDPTPTRVWEWSNSVSGVVGTDSATYTLLASDVGDTITVKQTETNAVNSANATSAATATIAAAPSGYTQNLVTTNGSLIRGANGSIANGKVFTLSLWFELPLLSGTHRVSQLRGGNGMNIQFDNSGKLHVDFQNSASTTIYDSDSTSVVLTAATQHHLYIMVDTANSPYITLKIDGSDVTMTDVTNTLSNGDDVKMSGDLILLSANNDSNPLYGDISDLIFDNSVIAYSTLHDTGSPSDQSARIGVVKYFFGDTMTADANGGDTAGGWNDIGPSNYNLGTASLHATIYTNDFTDA